MVSPSEENTPGRLVTLVSVETLVEAEVIMSMLSAYGIYTFLQPPARNQAHAISVAGGDLEDAKLLLSATNEPSAAE